MAMQRAKHVYEKLLADIKECDQLYLKAGLAYFKMPTWLPGYLVPEIVDHGVYTRGFHFSGERSDVPPRTTKTLTDLRERKAEVEKQMERAEITGYWQMADANAIEVAKLVQAVLKDLRALNDLVKTHSDKVMAPYPDTPFQALPENPHDQAPVGLYLQLHRWVMGLPEVRRKIDELRMDPDAVYKTIIKGDYS